MDVYAAVDIKSNLWGSSPAGNITTFGQLISAILPNVYILAGVLLFVLMIVGGFGIIAGASGGDSKKTGDGAKSVTMALLGFLIIFISYWIIKIIEVITGLNILNSTH